MRIASRSSGTQRKQMTSWSPATAIAEERRHVLEGEERVARQEALVKKTVGQGHTELAGIAGQMLDALRASLELSRERLRDLEARYGTALAEK
jgi:hypothetical protein